MLTHALLAVVLLVQPWLAWPHLQPDTSHRLTLVCCLFGLGLLRMLGPLPTRRLPLSWGAWVCAFLGILVVHSWHVIATGAYFEFFQETALFSDGLLALFTALFGLWALVQLPASDFRRLAWAGPAFLLANAAWVVWQRVQGQHPGGLLGMDRLLGAYAVLWVPICWTWSPWLAGLPLALIALCGKPLVWAAAAAVLFPLLRWRGRVITGLSLTVALAGLVGWMHYEATMRATQRVLTWITALKATQTHPVIGWGFSPMVWNNIVTQSGYSLPSLHSDWLALAVHAGWGLTVWTGLLWLCLVTTPSPVNRWAMALKTSFLGLGLLALVQETISHARILGVVIVFMAWWVAEQRESSHA